MLDFVEGHCCTQTVIPTTNPPLLTLHSHSHSLPLSLTLLKLTSSEFSKPWQIWMNSNETFNIIRHIANFTKPGVNLKSKHRMKTSDIECILYRTQYQFVYTIFKNNFTCPSIVTYSHMWSNLTTHTPTPLTNTHTPLTHPHHSHTIHTPTPLTMVTVRHWAEMDRVRNELELGMVPHTSRAGTPPTPPGILSYTRMWFRQIYS